MHANDSRPEPPRTAHVAGLSLGPVGGRSSLAVLQRTGPPDAGPGVWRYQVARLHRWELHTPYARIAADAPDLFPPAKEGVGRTLVIDASAVGTPDESFRRSAYAAQTAVEVEVVRVGGGVEAVRDQRGGRNVPEAHVAADALAAVESGRLTFAPGVPFAAEVPQELRRLAARVGAGGRQRETDDLTGAVAVALWYGERILGEPWVAPSGRGGVIANAPPGVFNDAPAEYEDDDPRRPRGERYPDGWEDDGPRGNWIMDHPT